MELNLQQRVCIKFCFKNGFNGVKTLEMLGNWFFSVWVKKLLQGTRFNSRKEVMKKIEGGSDDYTDNRVPEMFRELDQALA